MRTSAEPEGVTLVECLAVMVGRRNGDAGTYSVAGPQERAEIGLVGDPERSDNQVIPTAMLPAAAFPA